MHNRRKRDGGSSPSLRYPLSILSVGVLAFVFGQGCETSVPQMNVHDCFEGEVREQSCGVRDEGLQSLTCNAVGQWVTGPCILPPECDEGEIRELRCGSRMIEGEQRCQQGEWQTVRACTHARCEEGHSRPLPCEDGINQGRETCVDSEWVLTEYCPAESCNNWDVEQLNCIEGTRPGERLCVDGEWVTTLPCLELGCIDGDTRTLACGINGRGNRTETCINQAWVETAACNSNDICKDGASKRTACAGSDLGQQRQDCVSGQWWPQPCEVNSVDGSTMSNRRPGDGPWYVEKPFFCGVKNNGRVVCWGANDQGQLGQGHTNPVSGPVIVQGVTNAKQVSVGGAFACATTNNGAVFCWGDNKLAQTPGSTTDITSTPVQVPNLPQVDHISAGGDHACAVTRGSNTTPRALFCWGRNNRHQINASSLATLSPVRVNVGDAQTSVDLVAAGSEFTCVTTKARSAAGTYYPANIVCWGDRTWGQTGAPADFGTFTQQTIVQPGAAVNVEDIVRIRAGLDHTCIDTRSTTNEATYCWGHNNVTQLGRTTVDNTVPSPLSNNLSGATSRVSVGTRLTCAVRNQTAFAHCWGRNVDGDLGRNDTSYDDSPSSDASPVFSLGRVSELFSASAMASGSNNEGVTYFNTQCAITHSGVVRCWGHGFGKLTIPDGASGTNAAPVTVTIP